MLIMKLLFLVVAIVYTFSNFTKLIRGQKIYALNMWIMAISIVGFGYLQFGI